MGNCPPIKAECGDNCISRENTKNPRGILEISMFLDSCVRTMNPPIAALHGAARRAPPHRGAHVRLRTPEEHPKGWTPSARSISTVMVTVSQAVWTIASTRFGTPKKANIDAAIGNYFFIDSGSACLISDGAYFDCEKGF